MALGTGGQADEDKMLSAVDSQLGAVFEKGYTEADPTDEKSKDRMDLSKVVKGLSDEVRTRIDAVYDPHGGHEKVFQQHVGTIDLSGVDPAEQSEVRSQRVMEIAQKLYGPFLANSVLIFENHELKSPGSEKMRTTLNDVLEEGLPADADSLQGRKDLRVALSKLDPNLTPAMKLTFLREAIGAVDFAELAEEESKVEPLKEDLKSVTQAAADFKAGLHLSFGKSFQAVKDAFDEDLSLDRDKGIVAQIDELKSLIGNYDVVLRSRNIDPKKAEAARTDRESAVKKMKILESAKPKEVADGLKKLMGTLKICVLLEIELRDFTVDELRALVEEYESMKDDISYAKLVKLYAPDPPAKKISDALVSLDKAEVSRSITKKSGALREASGKQQQKVDKLQKSERDSMNLTDEQLALAINVKLLSQNPETSSLDKEGKAKQAKKMLLKDRLALDNDEYFVRVAEGVNQQGVEDAMITDRLLKFSFSVADKEDPKKTGKLVSPLKDLTAADFDPKDDLAIPRAIRAGRLDWKAAFVLFLAFPKLGEEHTKRVDKLEVHARELLAESLKTTPYSSKCEAAFQDQIAMLKPHVGKFFADFDNNRDKKALSAESYFRSKHVELGEKLRRRDLVVTDFDVVVAELEDEGYFGFERRLADGKIGIMPKQEARATLLAMFQRIPLEQMKKDRKLQTFDRRKAKFKKEAPKAALGVGKALKWYFIDAPLKILQYSANMRHVPVSLIKNWRTPWSGLVSGVKQTGTSLGGQIKADANAVIGKAQEKSPENENKDKSSGPVELDDYHYAKKSGVKVERLESTSKLHLKKLGKSAVILDSTPFIDLSKYKEAA